MSTDFRKDRKTWRYKFSWRGQVYQASGFATQELAEATEARHWRGLSRGTTPEKAPRDALTLGGWVSLWMGNHVKVNLRPRTAKLYRQTLDDHLLTDLGHVPLRDLTRSQLRAHLTVALPSRGVKRGVIQNVLIPLRACLNAAVEDGLLATNPVTGLGRRLRPRTVEEAAPVQVYSQSELDVLLWGAPLAIETLARSGIRLGELLGLEHHDIHDDYLMIERSAQWDENGCHVLAPKSGRIRRVDIPRRLATRLVSDGGIPYVFGGQDPVRPEIIRKLWHEHLDRFWIARHLRLHDLRHTYAATLLRNGAPITYVKEQLGHASITTTIDTYGHLVPGENRKWVDQSFGSPSLPP